MWVSLEVVDVEWCETWTVAVEYLVLRDVVVVCGRLRCNVMSDCVM